MSNSLEKYQDYISDNEWKLSLFEEGLVSGGNTVEFNKYLHNSRLISEIEDIARGNRHYYDYSQDEQELMDRAVALYDTYDAPDQWKLIKQHFQARMNDSIQNSHTHGILNYTEYLPTQSPFEEREKINNEFQRHPSYSTQNQNTSTGNYNMNRKFKHLIIYSSTGRPRWTTRGS